MGVKMCKMSVGLGYPDEPQRIGFGQWETGAAITGTKGDADVSHRHPRQ